MVAHQYISGISRRGQIKTFESIAVMIVFFFLLAFGMNFYYYVQESSMKRDFAQFEQMRAVQIAVQAQFLPELDCSYAGDITQKCVDEEKARAISALSSQLNDRFKTVFGYSDVNISVYNHQNSKWSDIKIYSNPKTDSGYQLFTLPIVVCDNLCDPATSRHYSFALLKVRAYD
ncbi:hypothetical protein HY483_01250 [Candidatus Woesearchaeota archaeon]|nr:hypothetical protein [Candidatus Woesearchaeota archaeon]